MVSRVLPYTATQCRSEEFLSVEIRVDKKTGKVEVFGVLHPATGNKHAEPVPESFPVPFSTKEILYLVSGGELPSENKDFVLCRTAGVFRLFFKADGKKVVVQFYYSAFWTTVSRAGHSPKREKV